MEDKSDVAANNDEEIILTVRAARRGRLPSSFYDSHCIRGLEKMLCRSASLFADRNHTRRIDAVLNTQDEVWQQGMFLADAII